MESKIHAYRTYLQKCETEAREAALKEEEDRKRAAIEAKRAARKSPLKSNLRKKAPQQNNVDENKTEVSRRSA